MRMKRIRLFSMLLSMLLPLAVHAQQAVRLCGHTFVPEQNVPVEPSSTRGQSVPLERGHLQDPTNGQQNALVQLTGLPTAREIQLLKEHGIHLGDYVGGYAYYALLDRVATLPPLGRGNRLASVVALRPEWKLNDALQGDTLPEYAKAGAGGAKVVIRYAPNAKPQQVSESLARLGLRGIEVVEQFRAVYAEMPLAVSTEVASLPWVLTVGLYPAPPSLSNREGRIIGRASVLNTPAVYGGRGLEGKGVRIGIWDANVTSRVDFGNRVHVQEYEYADDHDTHVAGSILGAGLLHPDARGMAPKAQAWSYNFNVQKNGLSAQQEMAIAQEKWGITLTQNSYGIHLGYYCGFLDELAYLASDYNLDLLANTYPTLQHIFAAGNDQTSCQPQIASLYGKEGAMAPRVIAPSTRSKYSLHVGAVDKLGAMTEFSSWGPQDDGRMFPTICAKGKQVLSTVPPNAYGNMDGTSMATPTVTGHAALISERYAQLNQGKGMPNVLLRALLANTATDAGRPGPDFQFGYGIMNAEHAVEALENGWYLQGELELGRSLTQRIAVPPEATAVKVMLVWNDPAVAKEYKFRDKTLVNDLDLTVNEYLPWVCDHRPEGLEKNAERKVDTLNNIEQVTLSRADLKGVTEIAMTVKAHAVAQGVQGFVLTWYFEVPEPRVISPADGMLCSQNGSVLLAVEGIQSPYSVELSYDGGTSWSRIGGMQNPMFTYPITIPADAPITKRALLRVVDAAGQMAVSPHPFTIAPQPTDLEIEWPECGTSGWKLTWEGNTAATEGYVVLLADPDKGTVFRKIGETRQSEFTVPDGVVNGIERPIFSVAAKVDDESYGKRSLGVLARYATPVTLTAAQLPFVESFVKYPTRYFSVEHGENIGVKYEHVGYGDVAVGSNLFALACTGGFKEFNADNYFDYTRNAKNIGSMTMCDLDLTGIPAGQNVLLRITGQLVSSYSENNTTARMRVKAGKDGDQVLTSLSGVTENLATKFISDWCYFLPAGQKHRVVIEFAGRSSNDFLGVVSVSLENPESENAVALMYKENPKSGANLGVESVKLVLSNRCTNTLRNLVVKAYRGDKWVSQVEVDELRGMAYRDVDIKVDLSTDRPLGELIPLRFECVVDPLNPSKNGYLDYTVNSMGRVVVQGTTEWYQTMFGTVPCDPKIVTRVTGPTIYTDNGGALGNHTSDERSTLKFLPSDPSKKVRVRFLKFKTTDQRAQLIVFTSDITTSELDLSKGRIHDILMGDLVGDGTPSITYVSEAEDGGITFYFNSISDSENEGWIAEVDMVEPRNPLALVGAEATLMDAEGGEVGEIPVKVKINNRWDVPQKDVEVSVLQKGKFVVVETLPEVQPGVHEYTLNKKLKVPMANPTEVVVTIEGDDTDARDNVDTIKAIYDRYCFSTQLPTEGNYPGVVQVYNKYQFGLSQSGGYPRYTVVSFNPFPAYKGDGKVSIAVTPHQEPAENWSLSIWVDWDDNGEFEPSEQKTVPLEKGIKNAVVVSYDLAGYTVGVKRMRLMMVPTSEITGPCAVPTLGDVQDFTLELFEGGFPQAGDLLLTKLRIGKSGKRLSATQDITFDMYNLSDTDFDGAARMKIYVDDLPPVEELVDCHGANRLAAYKGKREITLQHKADLSAVGQHSVIVELVDNPVPENNRVGDTVYCAVPDPNGFYAIDIRSWTGENEKLNGLDIATALNQEEQWTIDLIFRIDRPQFATLLHSSGFKLYTTYRMSGGVPDNAIAMHVDDMMLRWTKVQTIQPGRWHHLTATADSISSSWFSGGSCYVKVFIDGEECELGGNGLDDAPKFGKWDPGLDVFPKVDGQFKLLRTCSKALNKSEIKAFQYVRRADGTLPADYLSEFSFDEGTKNKMVFSGDEEAMEIITDNPERISAEHDGIWVKLQRLISGFRFDGQARVEETSENSYTITFDKGTDRARVTGEILAMWPGVSLTLGAGGQAITPTTVFDFTNPVEVVATATPFGHPLSQTVTLTFHEDLSKACDILSLKLEKSLNPGLLEEVEADAISQSCIRQVPTSAGALSDATGAKLTFSISENAKLYCKEAELVSGVTALDLSAPTVLTVVA